MKIEGSVALVTGANRGLGAAFCRILLEQGAATVYAAARNPSSVTMPGVVPLRLDITSPADIEAAAAQCNDVNLLVNNAGISTGTSALSDEAIENGRLRRRHRPLPGRAGTAALMCRRAAVRHSSSVDSNSR